MKRLVLVVMMLCSHLYGDACEVEYKRVPKVRHTTPTKIESIVRIATECCSCTGWIAGKDTFVTAAHCFGGPHEHIQAIFVDGHSVDLKLVKQGPLLLHEDQDMAVLTGKTGNVSPLMVEPGCSMPQQAVSVGYGPQHTQKAVLAFGGRKDAAAGGLFMYSGQIDAGDSGGPVLNMDGEVLGMQVEYNTDGSPFFYVVPGCNIYEFLHDH